MIVIFLYKVSGYNFKCLSYCQAYFLEFCLITLENTNSGPSICSPVFLPSSVNSDHEAVAVFIDFPLTHYVPALPS